MLPFLALRSDFMHQFGVLQALAKLALESSVLGHAMRPNPVNTLEDPDLVETLPASDLTPAELATPSYDSWDSEAPTAVHSRRPLFARPPRLPTT
jgi:hypothetical protein